MLLHVRNQRYKRLKIKNDQNNRSGNSSVESVKKKQLNRIVLLARKWLSNNYYTVIELNTYKRQHIIFVDFLCITTLINLITFFYVE